MKKQVLTIVLSLIALAIFAFAPIVTNVIVIPSPGQVKITYDLTADNDCVVSLEIAEITYLDEQEYTIGNYDIYPTAVTGDIGADISTGAGKEIIWIPNADGMEVGNYVAKVIADEGQAPAGFAYVPGGTFIMGDTRGGGYSEELPTHSVTLNSFYLSKYLVTQAEYQDIVGSNPARNYGVGPNYPVYFVNWYSAITYCNLRSLNEGLTPVYTISGSTNPAIWGDVPTDNNSTWNAAICDWTANGYRLPTEAEWEYAARGTINNPDYLYSGSEDLDTVGWYADNNSPRGTKPVGTKAPNMLGLYDMSGNLYEWCWDWWDANYYSDSPSDNPTGPNSGSYRVLRGGFWEINANFCRVAFRITYDPVNKKNYIGFRVCRANL
ncbi:MAG: SUMF1/EgtB/PvdO family nonheme iron enzyme [Candidatus Cloacimonetes bacterium]|nr:formylglycine-generating enzyme family protein [Candidatus Cloacimonadota bacterium]MDD2423060.1 SUMF1/EgtB/PvdO family nonheme iron enzyme [Candidatus Cloacimonadota bacterium]MDD4276897.1 SUMF1/EgtB/PvdO family nonheme iron enzyme [Candidatus Cloacimonadota bacterium]